MYQIFEKWMNFLTLILKKKKQYSFFASPHGGRKEVRILCEREGKLWEWNLHQFEKEMEVKYLFGLEFANSRVFKKVLDRCEKAKKRGDILPNEIWRGSLFEKEILEGLKGEVILRWMGPPMGYGLFAARDLPLGYYVGEYAGIVRFFSERKDAKNCYCFEYKTYLQGKTPFTIDAQDRGNIIRFINHRSSCNLTPQLAFCNGVQHVILLTNQPVAKGCELTYDYGPTYWSKREMPLNQGGGKT